MQRWPSAWLRPDRGQKCHGKKMCFSLHLQPVLRRDLALPSTRHKRQRSFEMISKFGVALINRSELAINHLSEPHGPQGFDKPEVRVVRLAGRPGTPPEGLRRPLQA